MRREGYELQVGQATGNIKEIDGEKLSQLKLVIDVPETVSGKAIELVYSAKREIC